MAQDEKGMFLAEVRNWVRDYYLWDWKILGPSFARALAAVIALCLSALGLSTAFSFVLWQALGFFVGYPSWWGEASLYGVVGVTLSTLKYSFIIVRGIRGIFYCWWLDRRTVEHLPALPHLTPEVLGALKSLMNVSACSRSSFTSTLHEFHLQGNEIREWSFFKELYQRFCV